MEQMIIEDKARWDRRSCSSIGAAVLHRVCERVQYRVVVSWLIKEINGKKQ